MPEFFSELMASSADFHFLRPLWFLGLIPAVLVLALFQWRKRSAGNWAQIINPALLPFLMQGETGKKRHSTAWLITGLALVWLLSCISLAGPTWQQLPQPVHKEDSALIVVFDLSPSMLAEDIKPSRLVRARYKLIDILKKRREGFTALVVYGGEAHTVSPLTEDSNTIISLVPILHPTLLPEYGSNTEEAIEIALELAINGGYEQADILLITDGVARSAFGTIQSMVSQAGKFRLSILGVGTDQGAPIPLGDGGFVKDSRGAILIPKLGASSLQALSSAQGGNYQTITAGDSDIEQILAVTEQLFPDATRELDRSFDLWDDQGYWLAILLLPALLLSFRKGAVVTLVFAPLMFSSHPVEALDWKDLWQTPDQQGAQALEDGDLEAAQSLFNDSQWRGSAAYKAGNYDQAIDDYLGAETADAHYNRGNSLAKSGDLEGAIEAYNQALKQQPEMEDAAANRDLVEKLKEQQEESSEQQDQDQEKKDQDKKDQQDQDQNQQQEDGDPQPSDSSDEQQEQDQQDQQPEETEQEKEEREQAEQEEKEQQEEAQAEPTEEEKQAQQEIEQMLRRVPDDPGGLLRAKFRYQSRQRALEPKRPKPPNDEERW
ncbi:MAG: VWA domain-containing protein [Pseudomonadales bacterium]|jgi:Ca-activated chloride channel family protein|tara:strand:- start:1833 stop:3647 length:1815 start_codon:yes stop_codon:yes gene_type:complete